MVYTCHAGADADAGVGWLLRRNWEGLQRPTSPWPRLRVATSELSRASGTREEVKCWVA